MNKRNVTSVFFGVALALATLPGLVHADLIISEYVEGTSNRKAIEIYNGTAVPIDLGQYELAFVFNGTTTDLRVFLHGGVLLPGQRFSEELELEKPQRSPPVSYTLKLLSGQGDP